MPGHVANHLRTECEIEVVVTNAKRLSTRQEEVDRALRKDDDRFIQSYWNLRGRLLIRYRYDPRKMTTDSAKKAVRRVIGSRRRMSSARVWKVQLELSGHMPEDVWKQKTRALDAHPAIRSAGILDTTRPPRVVLQLLETDTPRLLARIYAILQW